MGAAVRITRTDRTASELRDIASKSRDGDVVRRLLAIALVLDGRSRGDAALQTGMDRQILCDWVHRYNAAGLAGLKTRPLPGAAPRLTHEQMEELKALVIEGPDPEKHKVVRWRCIDPRQEIARRFSVSVHERTVGKWMRRLNLTRLQPRPFHPKKDADAQETFKKTSLS